jgi:hypothetical protein
MSLKTFHFVFIGASILLSLGFAVWALEEFASDGSAVSALFAALGLLAGAALVRYGVGVARKLRHVSYL